MVRKISVFFGVFFLAIFFLGFRWRIFGLLDDTMWADQAQFVQENDPRQFDPSKAYGHPGTTVVIGTNIIRGFLGVSWDDSLYLFLTLLSGLLIALSAMVCYWLRPNDPWWLVAGFMLSLDKTYEYATPPSVIASLLVVLLLLLTLLIHKHGKPVFVWGLVAGLLLATRFDMGLAVTAIFGFVILFQVGVKKAVWLMAIEVLVFIVVNPYMWFMPTQHLMDLSGKIFYHYAQIQSRHLDLSEVFTFSAQAIISILFALVFIVFRKRLPTPFPVKFILCMLILTLGLCGIFFTARYQSMRYLLPIIFIWQLLLPVFFFSLLKPRFSYHVVFLFIAVYLSVYAWYFWEWRAYWQGLREFFRQGACRTSFRLCN